MTTSTPPIRRAGPRRLAPALLVPALLMQTLLATPAAAQPLPGEPLPPLTASQPAQDAPGRVARLADSSGQVWLYSPNSGPDSGEWISPPRNQPLTSGDRLVTDPGARAELRVGSTRLRLDGGSELELTRLDDDHLALHLHAGSVAVRLRSADAVREFELTSDEGRFTALQPGRYRIDRQHADRRGAATVDSSTLTVYEGEAYYQGPGSALTVYPNQRADFWLDAAGRAQYAITEALADAFARWSGERDRDDDRAASTAARYVSPEMTGIEDLDRNGRWEQDAEYGALWIPSAVAADWAPYSAGRWAWVRPWGWTWVDDAPWGFAPFHYGRWLRRGETWCWAPGRYVQRPVYAPALVVWLRGGGADRGGRPDRPGDRPPGHRPEPSIGWFPLGPREPFVPSYRTSPRQAREFDGGGDGRPGRDDRRDGRPPRAAPLPDDFRNRHVPHALTALPEAALLQRPPGGVPTAAWRHAGIGRDDGRRDGRVDGPGERRGGAADAAPVLTPITAPPPPLRLATPVSPQQRSQGDRPDGGRPNAADAGVAAGGPGAGAGRDDAVRRPLPAPGWSPRPTAPLTQAAPPAGASPSPLPRGLPPPAPPAAVPPAAQALPAPARPPADAPLTATPQQPAGPLSAGRPPLPGEPRVDGRPPDGLPRHGAEQRLDERPDARRDDRRIERRDDGRDDRRNFSHDSSRDFLRDSGRGGDAWPRRDERRASPPAPAPAGPAPVTALPMPLPGQPVLRAPAPAAVTPPPAVAAPFAAPAQPAGPAFTLPQRPTHEAPPRPPPQAVQPQQPPPGFVPPPAAPRDMPVAPRPAPPAEPTAEAQRRPLPVNRPSADERRGPGPGNGPQRERERER